ncbi:trypsin-like peptidase domain-containing protein [Aeoliella sp. ICT_H6.2]|uniref:Trypsin-like peptidase domain-containing protein n=1 Tax=Aeoliella straminimaris TaxID=2954799 RepID=A0A9X2FD96_9BACT|nr:trypsin-like peptidase domain-containing protein [Aeoliella straminimaris]MCO6046850.1 trypsin-like peptidase domain-containing protein [Aeoliella straminimaris]
MKWSPLFTALLIAVALPLSATGVLAQEPAAPQAEKQQPEIQQAPDTPPQEEPQPEADQPAPEESAPSKPDEPKPEESKPEESKPTEPKAEEPKPEEDTPEEDKPAEDKPAEDKPAEDKPAEDKPAEPEKKAEEKGDESEEGKPQKSDEEDTDKEPGEDKDGESEKTDEEKAKQAEYKPVEWDEEVEKVLTQRYPKNTSDLKVIQKQTQRVIDHVRPAVVSVRVGAAFGSAVIVSPDGLVLTAGHVVGKPGMPVTFIFEDGSTARGKTLGMFREIDSGMMKITDPGPWPYVKMAEENNLKTGEWVVVMSHPGGFDPERTPPVRLGRVLFANDRVISTDCTLVGGDSGGALFNMHGDVVGINSRIGRRITDNFHVPIGTYHDTWDRLVAGESWGAPLGGTEEQAEARPLLGAAGNPNEPECKLSQVFPGMPADRAGLKVGDIVRSFNGEEVGTFDDLSKKVYSCQPGDTIKLLIARGEETKDVELRLGVARTPLPGSADMPKDLKSKEKGQKS